MHQSKEPQHVTRSPAKKSKPPQPQPENSGLVQAKADSPDPVERRYDPAPFERIVAKISANGEGAKPAIARKPLSQQLIGPVPQREPDPAATSRSSNELGLVQRNPLPDRYASPIPPPEGGLVQRNPLPDRDATSASPPADGLGLVQRNPLPDRYAFPTPPPEGGLVQRHPIPDRDAAPLPPLQAKLIVGPAKDRYEQEADRVASQVVQTINSPDAGSVQREGEEEEDLQMKPDRVSAKYPTPQISDLQMKPLNIQQRSAGQPNLLLQMYQQRLQRQVGAEGGAVSEDIETSIKGSKGGGQPLGDGVRQPMEQAFGADFGSVKVHTDSTADNLNRSLNARAFTTGSDLFFKQGEYNPGSSGGQELLAHELTHVVQQGGAGVQKKSAKEPIEVRRKARPTIQRLITGKELESVDPKSFNSKTYPKILEAINEYNYKAYTENITALKTGAHNQYNAITGTLEYIERLAEQKQKDRPVLGLLLEEINNERPLLEQIYANPATYADPKDVKGNTVFKRLRQENPNPVSTYKAQIKDLGIKTGSTTTAKKISEKLKSAGSTLKKASAVALVIEGIGHLAMAAIATAAGVGLAAANPISALGAFIAAVGQLIVAILKFVRAIMLALVNKYTKENGPDDPRVKKIEEVFPKIIACEAAVALFSTIAAIILIPNPVQFPQIASMTKQAIKLVRGALMSAKATKGIMKKGGGPVLTIVEAGLGLGSVDEIGSFAGDMAEDSKAAKGFVGTTGSLVKTARGKVGGVGSVKAVVDDKTKESAKSIDQRKDEKSKKEAKQKYADFDPKDHFKKKDEEDL